jgi:hypothetical protein
MRKFMQLHPELSYPEMKEKLLFTERQNNDCTSTLINIQEFTDDRTEKVSYKREQ